MSITISLRGGPDDGRTFTIPDAEPPWIYLIPTVPPLADILTDTITPPVSQSTEYELLYQQGWPRRDDDGAFLYQHRAPAQSPEQRSPLGRVRAEARLAEQQRAAGLDAAWQEIRRERPHFPVDWRDF
ncbi:hypothetical protein ACIA71_01450 [Streptomyces anulatus]